MNTPLDDTAVLDEDALGFKYVGTWIEKEQETKAAVREIHDDLRAIVQ